jgi:hypothetical protein
VASRTREAPLDDEGRRLLAIFEELQAEEVAAAKLISSPVQSVLYPEHMKMVKALEDLRVRSSAAWFAFRAYRKRERDKPR